MSNPMERYQKLGYKEALERTYLYPVACKELSLILRKAYNKVPKNLQSTIFQDTLFAFHLLPGMQTSSAASAALDLFQSAEAALPKQKKNLAATEFKQAKVAHKRRGKCQQEEESSAELPEDVLVHIFSYLDVPSLVSSALVCRSWNFAASRNSLWQSQYAKVFGDNYSSSKTNKKQNGRPREDKDLRILQGSKSTSTSADWRQAFRSTYQGNSSKILTSNRGYCHQCKAVVWLDNMNCWTRDCVLQSGSRHIIPISSPQVVVYLLNGSSSIFCSSDSDSESDEEFTPKLWAYPRHIWLMMEEPSV